jgi:hypothetical protein
MPVISHKTYSHKANYTPSELNLKPRQKKERRFMPGAYTPQNATMRIGLDDATFDIDYSVKESGYSVDLVEGIKVVLGKSTKKVLSLSFVYPTLEQLLEQMSIASKTIRARQKDVPQDSIKRNYQITAELLLLVQDYVAKDLETLRYNLTYPAEDLAVSI